MKKLIGGVAGVSLVVLLSFSCAQLGYAQTSTATIRGTILDPQARAIPNATVTARNVETGQERGTTTTNDGIYVIPNLDPGVYEVRVEVSGFSKGEAKAVKIQVGDIRDVNFILKLAGVTSEIKVTGQAPLVETTKTDTSVVIDDKQMSHLPVLNVASLNTGASPLNDYAGLAVTAPGVKFDSSANSADLLGPGAYNNRGDLINVDGGNISDQVVSARDSIGASLDEVKEFQIITNNYNAEYGQAGSLIINVITKSGTNALHGGGYGALRGRNFSASNYFYNAFNPAAAFRRAPFQKHMWGLHGGGPIVKDKTFWFLNFEQANQSVPLTLNHQAPDFTHSVTVAVPTKEILWSAKVDHQLVRNHMLSIRFNVDRQFLDNDLVQISQSIASPPSLTLSQFHDHTLNIGLVSTVTPHVVNEGRFFWHRFINILPDKSSAPGEVGPNFYLGAAFCCPQGGLQNRYQYIDNVTWTRGTHTIKGGVNISHFPYNSLFQQFHFGRWEGFAAAPPAPGPGNMPTTFTIGFGAADVNAVDTIYGLYVEDSWKIKSNLTFNYGLRYDYEDGAFRGGTLPKPGGGCFQANGIIPACSSDKNNFQPRLGIAWSPHYDSGFLHLLFGGPDRSVIRISAAEVTELAYLNVSLDSLNFDGVNLLTQSIDLTTAPGNSLLAFFPNRPPDSALAPLKQANFFGRVRPISNHLHNPETRHLSADFTRQVGNDFVFDLGYIGVLGYGQFGERDMNFPAILPDSLHPGFFYLGPRPDSRFLAVRTNDNSRTSAYHSGYVHAAKRFSHHFEAQGSYTFSKQLASTEDFYGTSEPGDPRNIRAERGPSQNDVRHLGNFSFVYESQKLMDTPIVSQIVNNWSIGIIGQLHSGNAYPISTGEVPFTGTVYPGVGSESQQRPNVLPDGTLSSTNIASNAGLNLLVGPEGSAACGCPRTTFDAPTTGPAPAASGGPIDSFAKHADGSPILVDFQQLSGNLQRNLGRGDPFYRFDLSLTKDIPIKERFGVELRANFINVFNHTNFILFNGNDILDFFPIMVGCPAGTACLDAMTGHYIGADGHVLHLRDLQHGRVSKDLGRPEFAGVGDPAAADFPRTIELVVKIHW